MYEMNLSNYVLIDCNFIHYYLLKKSDIEKVENEAFYNIKIIKEFNNDFKAERIENKCELLTVIISFLFLFDFLSPFKLYAKQ